jgi:predicted RNA binding protein YcfA (HicA-like mRNA interferase family)
MPLSGKEMVKLFLKAGWVFVRQNGSHVTVSKEGARETIPMHRELATGTEHKLLKRLKEDDEIPFQGA